MNILSEALATLRKYANSLHEGRYPWVENHWSNSY